MLIRILLSFHFIYTKMITISNKRNIMNLLPKIKCILLLILLHIIMRASQYFIYDKINVIKGI